MPDTKAAPHYVTVSDELDRVEFRIVGTRYPPDSSDKSPESREPLPAEGNPPQSQ